jgi:hypothetical protein
MTLRSQNASQPKHQNTATMKHHLLVTMPARRPGYKGPNNRKRGIVLRLLEWFRNA